MLEIFEKLINEHGSSVILRERLELYSDKYSMLEEKNKHLQTKINDLESELSEAISEVNRDCFDFCVTGFIICLSGDNHEARKTHQYQLNS